MHVFCKSDLKTSSSPALYQNVVRHLKFPNICSVNQKRGSMVLYSRSYPSTCVDLQECSFREKSDYWLTCEPWVFSIIRLLKCVCVNTLNCFPKAWLFYSHQIILYPCIFTLSGCLKPITKGAIVYWSRFSLGERSNGLRVNYTQHIIREAYCVWNLELLS